MCTQSEVINSPLSVSELKSSAPSVNNKSGVTSKVCVSSVRTAKQKLP
jgi:hypothetical protein